MMLGQTLRQLERTSDESVARELLPDLVLLGRARAAAAVPGTTVVAMALNRQLEAGGCGCGRRGSA